MEEQMLIEIPKEIENLQLPSPELLSFYKDCKNRTIWINDVDNNLIEFMKFIIQWNRDDLGKAVEDRVPIRVCVFSYGGEVDVCFSFISLIKLSKTPIYTINMGVAASAGALIFLSGKKRFAMDGSTCMIHSGGGAISGTAEQVKDATDAYNKLLDRMKDYILENTKISKNTYNRMKKNDWTIQSNEFVELGIADEIITDIDSILV